MEGDSVTLHTGLPETQRYDQIVWTFGEDGIVIVKDDREDNKTTFSYDEIYEDRLELNYQTGSLTITDTRITDTGLYKVKISGKRRTEYKGFSVTVSASGISSGGVAGIVVVVLLVMSGAVAIFVFFHRRRISEIKTLKDKLSVNEGDSFTLSSGHTELGDNVMTWRFKDKDITTVSEHQTSVCVEDELKDRVHVDPQTGSLTVTNSRTEDSGLYQLQISTEKSERKFTVTVREKIRKVSVMEGESFTLNTGDAFTQRPDMIKWEFKHKCIAELTGKRPSAAVVVDKDKRFTDRLELDHQTGSLTVTNTRTTDSGLYTLKIGSEDSDRKFSVTVRGWLPWEKRPEQKEVNEGDPFTLSSGHTELGDNVMTWRFKDKDIATVSEHQAPVCDEERFKDRVHVDPQTGSLTVKMSKTEDSGHYQLQISTEKSKRKFTVRVCEKIRKVSVMEGESFTLNTLIQRPDMIKWELGHKCIAEVIGTQPVVSAVVDDRFTNRLKMDHQTGSLTVTNSRTTDSGLYTLKIDSEDSEWKFSVNVREKIKTVFLMEGGLLLIRTGDVLTKNPDMIKWLFGDICIAELTGNTPAAADVDVDKDDRFRGRLKLDHQTFTIRNTRTTDSGLYTLRMRTGDSERKYIVNVRVLSKEKKGNDSEAAHKQTESHPLLPFHVAENKEEHFLLNVNLKP
ncbi:hypothetical protein E1301_Tti012768 [Triplophysa tibetana]|uniref:Immunoglobulin domain-containing protein n=1 Tax=Triplophysa tibetana TaxID=1572043 RepID=A0A5A9NRI3_9TELE|nr:hypothetical protein E1301_Tti012768 [Triplophysa tibetana]